MKRVLEKSLAILERDPEHAGGNYLVGRITAAGMRINPVTRFVAARIIGGDLLRQASWERAEASLVTAVEAEPSNPMHRIELAALLADTGQEDAARAQLRRVLAHPDTTSLVAYYKDQARAILQRLP